jgi:hypothetical protein
VGIEIGIDVTDVPPIIWIFVGLAPWDAIAAEIIGLEIVAAHQTRQHVLSKICLTVLFGCFQSFQQDIGVEKVFAHRDKRHVRIAGHGWWAGGLFLKCLDQAPGIGIYNPEGAGLPDRHRQGGYGGVRLSLAVKTHHLANVHAVDMITTEHRHHISGE